MIERKGHPQAPGTGPSEITQEDFPRKTYIDLSNEFETGDTVDGARLDQALKAGKITESDYVKLASKVMRRDALIIDNLSHVAEYQTNTAEDRNHDKLTGLKNLHSFEEYMGKILEKEEYEMLLVMFIDINNFKPVNDTRGHDAGDKAIITVAQALQEEQKRAGNSFRKGGDEFLFVLPVIEHKSNEPYSSIPERIRERIDKCLIDGGFPELSVAIGCAMSPKGVKSTPEELIQKADVEMYKDKRKYK